MKIILFVFLCLLTSFSLSAQPLQTRQSSFEKIDQALAKGEINAADAAGFRVLAFFHDAELPPQFHSDPEAKVTVPSDRLLDAAAKVLPQMQQVLALRVYTYMIPPAYLPSTKNKDNKAFPIPEPIPGQNWIYIENVSSEVRVWFLKDQDDQLLMAHQIRSLLSDEIIPAEKALMNRTHPRDDLNSASILVSLGVERVQPNGGDGKLDVYLYNIPPDEDGTAAAKAWVMGYHVDEVSGYGCPARPSFMSVNLAWAKTADPKKLASTLAHEYFHAIQNSYDRKDECAGYNNVDEGTATYLKHHVYPKYNDEHDWWEFSENGGLSLLDGAYETWPFYFFMVEMQGSSVLQKSYEMMGSNRAIEAINKTLSGGFQKQWIEYAVYEWNQEPLQDGFRQWDDYNIVPGRGAADAAGHVPPIKIEKVALDANGQYRYPMKMELKPLTRDFYAFDVSDASIRTVAIENPVFWNGRKVNAKVLVRKKGQTQFDEILWEDPQHQEYHYCFDKKDEDIDLIVLVVGNYQYLTSGTVYRGGSVFKVSNQGCYGFDGKITGHWEHKESSVEHSLEVEGTNIKTHEGKHGDEGGFKNNFYLTNAVVSYSYHGRLGDCSGFASGFMDVELGPKSEAIALASYNVAPEAWGQYHIGIRFKNPFISVTYVCPSPKPPITTSVPVVLDSSMGGASVAHHHGNPHLAGKVVLGEWTVDWDFSPVKE